MRKLRTLVLGALALAAVPSTGHAQQGRPFTDAWFVGAKGGAMTFWTTRVAHQTAPVYGVETLITRKQVGLYVAYDQSNFSARSTYRTFEHDSAGNTRYAGEAEAQINNSRRVTAALMAFPTMYGNFRPYGGAGFALNFLRGTRQTAGPITTLGDSSLRAVSSNAAPIFMVGTQYALRRLSVFGQGSYMPSSRRFLFNSSQTFFLEAGVRYNIGSSIDRVR